MADNWSMRQMQFFSSAELATMRDRTASRRYSPEREAFRREHERHRVWGLARRHADRLRHARSRPSEPAAEPADNPREEAQPARAAEPCSPHPGAAEPCSPSPSAAEAWPPSPSAAEPCSLSRSAGEPCPPSLSAAEPCSPSRSTGEPCLLSPSTGGPPLPEWNYSENPFPGCFATAEPPTPPSRPSLARTTSAPASSGRITAEARSRRAAPSKPAPEAASSTQLSPSAVAGVGKRARVIDGEPLKHCETLANEDECGTSRGHLVVQDWLARPRRGIPGCMLPAPKISQELHSWIRDIGSEEGGRGPPNSSGAKRRHGRTAGLDGVVAWMQALRAWRTGCGTARGGPGAALRVWLPGAALRVWWAECSTARG